MERRWVRGGGSRGWVGSMVAEEAVVLFWDVDIGNLYAKEWAGLVYGAMVYSRMLC